MNVYPTTGTLKHGKSVLLKKNGKIRITSRNISGTAEVISANYACLISDATKGDKIFLDDGLIELRVLSKIKDTFTCKIIHGGAHSI